MQRFRSVTLLPATAAVLFLAGSLRAGDVSVTAELTRSRINEGEMAELQVKVTGTQQADLPREIGVDGLQIRLTGQSTQVQMVNFKVSSSVIYSYIVMPLRTGSFTVPSITVTADGKSYRTPQLPFTVESGRVAPQSPSPSALQQTGIPGMMPRRPRTSQQRPEGRLAFGEISCPKKTLYAGEVVPVEIRYYFDGRYPVQVTGRVDFGAEGVLVERFPDPKESREERDGVTYNVLTFRSLLSAVKPGQISIPPAKLPSQIQLPGALPPGFDDPVFQQLMGGQAGFSQTKELTVATDPLKLEILPLPKEGRPASFAGAVGQFDIDALVANPRPSPGDPLNLIVKIGGKGNFKGMGPPVLTETSGWRSYPPGDKFEGTDDLSYAGVKSFDYTLIAQEPKTSSPGCEFSYFDPVVAKYVTLATKPLPVTASPGAIIPSDGSTAQTSAPVSSQAPATPSGFSPAGKEPLAGITLRSWTTPAFRFDFLIASAAMLVASVALAAILSIRQLRLRGGTAAARRKRESASLLALVSDPQTDGLASHEAAVAFVRLAPDSPERSDLLLRLEERLDALKFGARSPGILSEEERANLLASLRSLPVKSRKS
jgi:hypothetical protein